MATSDHLAPCPAWGADPDIHVTLSHYQTVSTIHKGEYQHSEMASIQNFKPWTLVMRSLSHLPHILMTFTGTEINSGAMEIFAVFMCYCIGNISNPGNNMVLGADPA